MNKQYTIKKKYYDIINKRTIKNSLSLWGQEYNQVENTNKYIQNKNKYKLINNVKKTKEED